MRIFNRQSCHRPGFPRGIIGGTLLLGLAVRWVPAATLSEEFAVNPLENGWAIHGNESLFAWDPAHEWVRLTWDTESSNSFLHLPLGRTLTRTDDFTVGFDLMLEEVWLESAEPLTYAFQVAVGLVHVADATSPEFRRGSGTQSPNLVEFDYFPDTGFGATVSPAVVSTNSRFATSFTFPLELTLGNRFRVEMTYTAGDATLRTTMTRNGESFGPVADVVLGSESLDFQVDAFSFSSYADHDPGGALLVRGIADNVAVTFPGLEIEGGFEGDRWQVRFPGEAGMTYRLERTMDFAVWLEVAGATADGDGAIVLEDSSPPAEAAFYRVRVVSGDSME